MALYDSQYTQAREDELVAKLVAYCQASERAPKPPVKPRAVIVISEAGTIRVRHRSARTGGQWTNVRAASLDEAKAIQRSLMLTVNVLV